MNGFDYRTCIVEGCQEYIQRSVGGDFCTMHRTRWRAYGTPTPVKICYNCKNEFVWMDKAFSFDKSGLSKGMYVACRDCVSLLEKYRDFLPAETRRNSIVKHGISLTQYVELLISQDFSCALCLKVPQYLKRMSIDHDHSHCPGAYGCKECIRGIICAGCNTLIGYLENKKVLVQKFEAEYNQNRPFKSLPHNNIGLKAVQ